MPRWLVVFDDLPTFDAPTAREAVEAAVVSDEDAFPYGGHFVAINLDELQGDLAVFEHGVVTTDRTARMQTAYKERARG